MSNDQRGSDDKLEKLAKIVELSKQLTIVRIAMLVALGLAAISLVYVYENRSTAVPALLASNAAGAAVSLGFVLLAISRLVKWVVGRLQELQLKLEKQMADCEAENVTLRSNYDKLRESYESAMRRMARIEGHLQALEIQGPRHSNWSEGGV